MRKSQQNNQTENAEQIEKRREILTKVRERKRGDRIKVVG